MRNLPRRPAVVVLLALVVSLAGIIIPTAASADSIPPLQHAPTDIGEDYHDDVVVSPTGSVTVPCNSSYGTDLRTYNASGQLIQQIPRTPSIDGVENCITTPVVGKNGDAYGIPSGDPNLLAYDGNTLKWKYPVSCGSEGSQYVIGADGNIYATNRTGGDVHVIGLTPEVTPPATQPTKVFDVEIQDDCDTMLYAYKDGIMVRPYSGHPYFYSYGGVYLGESSVSGNVHEAMNANGQLFAAKTVAGSGFTSISVSMYDPLTKKVMWTTPASTSGADTNGVYLVPLAGSGVAALVTEQKMDAPGVPASPTTWVKTLVIINAVGQAQAIQLPTADPNNQNNTFGDTFIGADATGKVVVVRQLDMDTQISWPSTVPAITVGVFDPASNTWPYTEVISGEPDDPSRPYGYELDWQVREDVVHPAAGSVNIVAQCKGKCPTGNSHHKLYAVTVNGLGQDYPRNTVINAPSSVPYAALGDSYSAGEGVPPFEDGTETTGTNMCHRSHHAYGRLIGRNMENGLSLGMGGFYACSGAETKHIADNRTDTPTPQYNEGLQVSHLDAHTKVVTLTVGGNDVGFEGFATGCFDPSSSCAINSAVYNTTLGKINNELPGKLSATYQAILSAAPNAQVYVIGYPQVAPVKTASDPIDARCPYLYDGGTNWADAQGARSIVTKLDEKIEQKVNDVRAMNAGNTRLHYIDVNASGSPFVGHTVCAEETDSFFNNADQALPPGQVRFVFHPNQRGQAAYAQLVADALN